MIKKIALVFLLGASLNTSYCFHKAFVLPAVDDTSSYILPGERRIVWNPGIPGGIPEISGPVENILDHGADATGSADSKDALILAINALPPGGGVVYIPEGTYRIGSKLTVGRDSIIFRGMGPLSKLLFESEGNCFDIITYRRGDWQNLPQGAAKDSMHVTVPDGSLFSPGEFAEIEQDNDSLLMYTRPEWIVSWAENSVGQLFEVERVLGNEVYFKSPVHHNFSTDLQARIRPQGFVQGVGFEDFYIEKRVAQGHTFAFKNTAYCWIRNVESYHTRKDHVNQSTCLGNEIRDSYFHRSFSYGGGGSGYGVECGFHVTNTLVENNIFDSLRHAMLIQLGANGNVYGYNYSVNPVQGDGETNLNIGWIPPDISIHGHYPYMNLFEGNELEEIGIGDYWGPAGPGNTYFRNKIKGEGIIYYDASHQQNLIGNITTILVDPEQKSLEKLEHGNVVGGVVRWDSGIAQTDLSASYYLDSVPSFFEDHTWPPFGPEADAHGPLPATTRFENLPFLHVSLDQDPVAAYERLEFTIENGKNYINPFDPEEVDISGQFISPGSDTLIISAFWEGESWKLRFAGAETGVWTYNIVVGDPDGEDRQSGRFRVIESEASGWLRPSEEDPHYLSFDDGSPFFGVGMAVPWLINDSRYYEQADLLSHLQEYGVNMINWLFTSWDILLIRDSYDRYSMEDAEKFDALIEDAEQHGIKLVLGIWIHDLLRDDPHPWSGFYDWQSNPFNALSSVNDFFSDSTSWEFQKKYYRYIIARWGYSSSIAMWHTVAEINGTNAIYDPFAMKNDEKGWHNKINDYFLNNDPYAHPTTVSGSGAYDFSEGWEVTAIPQAHEYPYPSDQLKENADRIAYWSDLLFRSYEKPVLIGEFGKSKYESGKSESFLHNGIWAGLMSGACSTPLHWWGGQIASRPENFSTFNETMISQLKHLSNFIEGMDMASYDFTPVYSVPAEQQPLLSNIPEGKVYGLSSDSLHLFWIYHVSDHSGTQFTGVEISIPGLADGRYRVSFYNTWEGTWSSMDTEPETVDGILNLECPGFSGDIAIKMAYAGPALPSFLSDNTAEKFRIFPNPCNSVLHVENLDQVRSVRLLNVAGQVLINQTTIQQSRSKIDLSSFREGIYLLEITDHLGIPSTYKIVYQI